MYNCMWNVIITLTSVGYGDLYPKSFWGRVVGIIICFWGVFIVSFFVVTVTNMINFTANEEKAYQLLLRLYYKQQLKRDAVAVLSSAFAHRNAHIEYPGDTDAILSLFRVFRSDMLAFKNTAGIVRNFNEGDRGVDVMQEHLEELIEKIDKLEQSQFVSVDSIEHIIDYLEANCISSKLK